MGLAEKKSPAPPPRRVVIFGGSLAPRGEEAWRLSEELGRALAEQGWIVATGGYGGVMEAASAGAESGGGRAVGVLCNAFGSAGNAHLTERIVTANLFERLEKLIELGDAYVCMPGSTGTLAELTLVWELVNKRLLPLRPIFCLGSFWRPVVSIFGNELTHDPRFPPAGLPDRKGDLIQFAESPEEIVRALRELWG